MNNNGEYYYLCNTQRKRLDVIDDIKCTGSEKNTE